MLLNLQFCVVITVGVVFVNTIGVLAQDAEILYNLAKIGSVSEKITADCRNDLGRILNSIDDRQIWAMKVHICKLVVERRLYTIMAQIVIGLVLLLVDISSIWSLRNNILYDLANIGSVSEEISVECCADLKRILNSIDERKIWAMKILDSSGKFGSGFIWGNNYLLGDRNGCRIANNPIYISQTRSLNPLNPPNLISEGSPIPIEYRMVYIRHRSHLQFDLVIYDRKVLHLGLCFPQSCTDDDTMELARDYFYKHDYVGHEMIGDNITVLSTKTLKLRSNFWDYKFIQILVWITIFNVLNIVIGTLYTYNVQQNRLKLVKKTDDATPIRPSLIDRWFASFSLIENTKAIFNLNVGADSVKIVHGIRAIGQSWLIMGHVIYFSINSGDNLEVNIKYGDIWYFQPVTTDFLGVDNFIVLGAFLLSFLYFERLKTGKKENAVVLGIKSIILRYLRLTPLYIIVIFLTYALTIYLGDTTSYSILEDYEKNCDERLWTNLLYINNLFPMKDSCLNWSWYLANDFQSFTIALIVIIVFTRNKKLGLWLGAGISVVSMGVSMYFAAKLKFAFAVDKYFNTGDLMYYPTWNRLAAYFVAVAAGWYFSKENRQLRLSKFYKILYWILAETILFGTMFLHVFKEYNLVLAVLYSGFGRILWSIATSWLIIACASNNGGPLTKILEAKIWIPFSRMSYACYLINPIFITSIFMLSETSYHVNLLIYIIESIGFIIFSFFASYIMMVVYESPFNMLVRTFIENKR